MQQTTFNPGENYPYPLIIKKLLDTPMVYAPDQQIVYRDTLRYTYRDLYDRIHRLAAGLDKVGIKQGDTVAVFDYDSNRFLDVICKTGLPIPLVEFEVMNTSGEPLPHDGFSTGEVVMRAPWLTKNYFKSPEKTAELWRNGWLHSGDVGHIDKEGYLQVTDRIKDVIKSGGEWISSLDLENIMSQHEAVLESAAIGVIDETWGERPLMLVVLKSEFQGTVNETDLKAYMQKAAEAGKLPRYGVPDNYRFVEEIPKTSVGKLDKKLIRKMYR